MKKYIKPTIYIEKFSTDMNIASSECKKQLVTEALTKIGEQNIACVKDTSLENAFSEAGGCATIASYVVASSAQAGYYSDFEFLYTFCGNKYKPDNFNAPQAEPSTGDYYVKAGDIIVYWSDGRNMHGNIVSDE